MIGFRHAPPRYPFLWESPGQPAGRWHAEGEGPVQYLADNVNGAWAEFLRHEEISEPEDLAGVRRALWMVDLGDEPRKRGTTLDATRLVSPDVQRGGLETYAECRAAAREARGQGFQILYAHSAALRPGEARGWRTDDGLRPDAPRDGGVLVYFGRRPDLVGWELCSEGRPGVRLLSCVRPLG